MKKGGISDVNGFISFTNKENGRKKDAPKSTKLEKSQPKNVDRISKPETSSTTSRSIKHGSTATKSQNVPKLQNEKDKIKNVAMVRRSSTVKDSNNSMLSKKIITMDDVYKTKIKNSNLTTIRRGSKVSENVNKGTSGPFLKNTNLEPNEELKKEDNMNLMKNEILHDNSKLVQEQSEETQEFESEYEDDFEDYESDFESDNNNEEEVEVTKQCLETMIENKNEKPPKMESNSNKMGNTTQRSLIKEAIEKENNFTIQGEILEHPVTSIDNTHNNDKSITNFLNAKKRLQLTKGSQVTKKRGAEIMKMIKMDVITYNLFEMTPIPYDEFMKFYSNRNTTQVFTQTNDEGIEEEIQTDELFAVSRWTQFPPNFTPQELTLENLQQLTTGVQMLNEENKKHEIDLEGLNDFMASVGQEMLDYLTEQTKYNEPELNQLDETLKLEFTENCIQFRKKKYSILENTIITIVNWDCKDRILSVHMNDCATTDTLICVWNRIHLSEPDVILCSAGHVKTCTISYMYEYVIFAGNYDGSISIWDLDEKNHFENDSLLQPSYTTGLTFGEVGHKSQVIDIQTVPLDDENSENTTFIQICSLEENGLLIVWSFSRGLRNMSNISSAPWSKVHFTVTYEINIAEFFPKIDSSSFETTALSLSSEYHVYIGTNFGHVVHCSFYGAKSKSKVHSNRSNDLTKVTSIKICPVNKIYFLVGTDNGFIHLFNRNLIKPLIEFSVIPQTANLTNLSIYEVGWISNSSYIIIHSNLSVSIWDLNNDSKAIKSWKDDRLFKTKFSKYSTGQNLHLVVATPNGNLTLQMIKPEHVRKFLDSENIEAFFTTFLGAQ